MNPRPNEPSADAPEAAFIDSAIFKLLVASTLLAKPFMEKIGPSHSLSLPEWRSLVVLDAKGALSNVSVAELTGLDAMTVSRALDRLHRSGRVERIRDPDDKRHWINRMTRAGRTTYRAILKEARKRQRDMTGDLTISDIEGLHRTLDRIIDHLRHTG
jgi:DNA-binding MarR family transcriptional regulator